MHRARDTKSMQFANFVLKFGATGNMLDYYKEIVRPAFFESGERDTRGSSYFLDDVGITVVEQANGKSTVAIAGRFIKKTQVERYQIWDEANRRLISDRASLETAPSATFALILNNHRLIYLHDTPSAPGLEAFRNTIQTFLKQQYARFVTEQYQAQKVAPKDEKRSKRLNKKDIAARIGAPNLVVVPLAGKSSLSAFLQQFKKLSSVELRVIQRNNEIDNDEIFRGIAEFNQDLGPDVRTVLRHQTTDAATGLPREKVAEQLNAAAKQGTYAITLRGVDKHGGQLQGDNNEFSYKASLTNVPQRTIQAAKVMYTKFRELLDLGILQGAMSAEDNSERMNQIVVLEELEERP